ncbi:unnamed protein product [Adineta steineri]|uniref:Vitellogenin domain-containing protein n=2 Tax=Adineta steineri TaxID=433720 RepID=A0A814YMR7_9BILA|nr:unnamed protein product [Adineta steineri]CAF1527962.1 unnamed protein product [Adineta steineri]
MFASSNFRCIAILLLVSQAWSAPLSSTQNPDPICSAAQLLPSGHSLIYKYKTDAKLSVANAQYDLKNQITADAHIRNLGDCNYAIQLRNVKITETKDEQETTVTATASAQRELENLVVRFRWVDGFIVAVEADSSAKVDHVNFVKGLLSILQVYSPVPTDGENIVREEDVLGVCTTRYKYTQKAGTIQINKYKDLSTCSRDKLHLSSSPVLTSVLGPLFENVFSSKKRYVCQTEVREKKIQTVKCKTIEMETDEDEKSTKKSEKDKNDDDNHVRNVDSSSEEDNDIDFNDKDDEEEISTKHESIKQELKLVSSGAVNVDGSAIRVPVRQTLQFAPRATFDRSNEPVSALVTKIQALFDTKSWNQFAASRLVDITNELRRMDKASLETFKSSTGLKHLVPTLLNTIYAHDPSASLLNLDTQTLKFAHPLSVFYLDKPSSELVEQIVNAARRLIAHQVPEFVGPAAAILKTYKSRQDNNKDADAKIKDFQRSISKFLNNPNKDSSNVTTAVLSAYAQLGLYDEQVRRLAANDQASLEVQYHALNAIRHICPDNVDDNNELRIRTDLQNLLLRKLQNKANKNAVRVWAFEALYTSFIYNPEEADSTLGDALEKAFGDILNEPLNQVNGYIWSTLKYASLDRLCPLRGLAARLRVHHHDKKQFAEQATLSSRQLQMELPLRKNYRAFIQLSFVFENDRIVPSFIGAKLAFDGIRRETLRLPWVDLALISENLDWNFAEYFFRMDSLNKANNVTDDEKTRIKNALPPPVKRLQDAYDNKEEDPDPSVHLYLKLFGADVRSRDITDKVQDVLKTNLRTFIRNQIMSRLQELSGKNPLFRIPLEIGAATGAANGLTLFKSVQVGIMADLTTVIKTTQDSAGMGLFSLTSRSALSFSLTLQREITSPLSSIGETIHIGALSNIPFEYTAEANQAGRIREFNLLNTQSTLLATDFQYSLRTSKGLVAVPITKTASIEPSCTSNAIYRGLGIRACLELNPFRSVQLGSRPSYPITITISKEPSIKKYRVGWRFNAQDAPQYEVAVEKVGVTGTYPGLGISATKTGNDFDIKVLTGMKSFNVKGTHAGNRFTGKVYSSDNKEVMTTSGTLVINNDGFKLDSNLVDLASRKEILKLTTDILPNRGQGLSADISLTTPDQAKSFKINFRGDLYKPNQKLVHIDAGFKIGDVSYSGKAHLERSDDHTRIELHRTMKLSKTASQNGYEFLYDRKCNHASTTQNDHKIQSHLAMRVPNRDTPMKVFDFKTDFARTKDLSNATLHSSLDFVMLTRQPPVAENIQIDYVRRSIRTVNQARRLVSPEANLKVQVKTRSNVFNFLLDHKHRRSSEASKKGPETLPPTLDINNKIHIIADTDKLFPDLPRPFAFDILSDLDFELLNKINYKFQYDLRRRQRSGLLTYSSQVDKVTNGHLYSGTSKSELQWDNKQKKATATGNFVICTHSRSLKTHWDIDTNLVQDKNDMTLDINARFDRQPKKDAPKSFIGVYNITLKAPKHESFQLIDIDGNVTKQAGLLETYNSIAYRVDKDLKEININLVVDRNTTGDGSIQSHATLAIPFLKNLPLITHDLVLERSSVNGRLSHVASQLIAKPVFSHYGSIDIDRATQNGKPCVHIDNEIEYLRGNGDSLHGLSKIDVHRWSKLHSFGLVKRNTDLLHKHSIGYIFSNKTRKVALSLESPQLSGNPLSIIGELTIDRENRIGKMNWPQEFGVHFEFGTPLSNLTAIQAYYNLPMFHKDDDQTVDASIGFKVASPKITPISFHFHSEGSLNTSLHATESLNIGDDIALNTLLTAKYNTQSISQISVSTSSKYYDQEFQNSLYALFKQHQVTIRGILNTTTNEDYKYEMDIGFDDDTLTGHTERTDGQQTIVSDIDAKKCSATGKYYRCYKGDITIRTGSSGAGQKGTFDVSYGRGAAKLDVKVPNNLEIKVDHIHTGRLRDEDFSSKTTIEGKSLRANNRGALSYSGTVEKEDGKWNTVQLQSSLSDKTGQKLIGSDIRMNSKIINKLSGQYQRKIVFNYERKGQSIIAWSSESNSCPNNPSNVLYGICQTTTFNIKANNKFVQRLRQRFELTPDPMLSNPTGHVPYDGTLKLDLKHDPKSGPHTVKLDVNRMKADAVDLDITYQPRHDNNPMKVDLKASLPRKNPISVKYDETLRSQTKFNGILKYSFNANDNTAEKTYQCEVDRQDAQDVSVTCKGERTSLSLDIDRKAGKSKIYVDLNRFPGQRFGYEATRDPQTQALDATLYTLVSSWNIKRQPGRSITLTVKQKNLEVLRVEGTKAGDREYQIRFSPSNINLRLDWDNSTSITLKQTSPQARNLAAITIDRAQIRHYLPSLRNQNRPSHDIDEAASTSKKPLVEITFDSHVLISLSQAIDKLGSHNGLFGLDTIKKAYKLQIGDAPVTIYNTQHWKTHREHSQLPESYSVRIVNNANGNFVQLTSNKWNEDRQISKISHSFDGGKTSTTDLKLSRNYGYQVGSVYFFHSLGYRNVEGAKQLRNFTRTFLRNHLMKDMNKTSIAELVNDFRKRVRNILDVDYNALKAIVARWKEEPEKNFLRQWSTRLGLSEFFAKYPTYTQASEAIFATLQERTTEREAFWRERIATIVNDNRIKDLAERVQARRSALIKDLLDRAEKLLDRFLPTVDQANVEKRIQDYVTKLLAGFERVSKQRTEQMKAVFKAIDDASKGEENKWFRTLVADIDSNAFSAAADAESAKVFKKLGDSSKLLVSNINKLSRRITKRREAFRERILNAIRHIPKAYINTTNFELFFPIGRQPGSYAGTSETMLALGSLLRNRDQAFDTIRSVLVNRFEARAETRENYFKALRSLVKRLFKRNPSLTPEFKAVIAQTGDAIDLHGNYIYLDPSCDYLVAHDFGNQQFSFRFINSKIYLLSPNRGEVKEYECSDTGRVQVCNNGNYYTLNVPMHYGDTIDGALGNARDRTKNTNLNRWLVRDCPAATRNQPRRGGSSIVECSSSDDDKQDFCENFVLNGVKNGQDRRRLITQAIEARKQAT